MNNRLDYRPHGPRPEPLFKINIFGWCTIMAELSPAAQERARCKCMLALSCTGALLERIIDGRREIPVSDLQKLADILGCSPAEIAE